MPRRKSLNLVKTERGENEELEDVGFVLYTGGQKNGFQIGDIKREKRKLEKDAEATVLETMLAAKRPGLENIGYEVELFLRGNTAAQIADIINDGREEKVTSFKVLGDIRRFIDVWRKNYLENTSFVMATEMARIDRLEETYWEAWEASKRPLSIFEDEETEKEDGRRKNGNGQENKEEDEAEKRIVQRIKRVKRAMTHGDVEFLKGIERCMELRFRVLGIGTTRNVNVSWRTEAQKQGLNPDEIIDAIVRQVMDSEEGEIKGEEEL